MNTLFVDKTINYIEATRKFSSLISEVETRGERFVINKHGEAIAVVVPISFYRKWQEARGNFFATIKQAASKSNLPSKKAEKIINEAIKVVRASL